MESWHRVGQKVVVKRLMGDETSTVTGYNLPLGSIWTVSWIGEDADGDIGFRFVENDPRPSADGWWVGYFAPVRDTSIVSLRTLLNPTPQAKREYMDELAEHAREDLHAQGFDVWR